MIDTSRFSEVHSVHFKKKTQHLIQYSIYSFWLNFQEVTVVDDANDAIEVEVEHLI